MKNVTPTQDKFELTEAKIKGALGLVALVIAIVGIYSVVTYMSSKEEAKWQESFYLAEKTYNEKKEALKTPTDMKTDFGGTLESFNKIIDAAPKSNAAKMSALYVSDISLSYKNIDIALDTLKKVEPHLKKGEILSALVANKTAALYAEKAEYQKAIDIWQGLITDRQVQFLHDDAKLSQGLCYEKLGKMDQAVLLYNTVQQNKSNPSASKTATKYLKLLKMNGANEKGS